MISLVFAKAPGGREGPRLDRAALDAALIAAHEAGDHARLAALYTQAAERVEAAGETDACCFFLTQAYVFALVTGAPEAGALRARLMGHGREE